MARGVSDKASFIGRDAEQAALERHLRDRAPVVTILGPGGMGKTRLAVRIATSFARDGRTWAFADLSEAHDVSGVIGSVAAALGVTLADVSSDEVATRRIGDALAQRRELLLVVDNVEAVAAEVEAVLDAWMDAEPGAQLLLTSRVRLGRADPVIELAGLTDVEGLRLFEEHARRRVPAFTSNDATRELVRRLDGSPLAIELAAARAHVLPPEGLIERFARHLDLVSGGRHARQASLRAVVAGSWALSTEEEQRALSALAIFSGGFALDAAERVLDAAAPGAEASLILASLLDKSLLRLEGRADDALRYALSESVRSFALGELDGTPDRGASARAAHAAFFLELAARTRSVEALLVERENLLAAFRVEPREALALEPVFAVGLSATSLRALFVEALGRVPPRRGDAVRAELLVACGLLERRLGRPEATGASIDEALALAASAGRPDLEAQALFVRVSAVGDTEGPLAARAAAEAAVEAARRAQHPALLAKSLQHVAWFAMEVGDVASAERYGAEALAIAEDVGFGEVECLVHNMLGSVATTTGQFAAAELHFDRGLAAAESVKSAINATIVRANLLRLLVAKGDPARARSVGARAIEAARAGGFRRVEGVALLHLATLELEHGAIADARARALHAERVLEEVGYRRHHGSSFRLLGAIALEEGRADVAAEAFSRALEIAEGIADQEGHATALAGLAAAEAVGGGGGDAAPRARMVQAETLAAASGRAEAGRVVAARAALVHGCAGRVEEARAHLERCRPGAGSSEVRVAIRRAERALDGVGVARPGEGAVVDAFELVTRTGVVASGHAVDAQGFDLLFDAVENHVVAGGRRVDLRKKPIAARILEVLLADPGAHFEKARLFEAVWRMRFHTSRAPTLYKAVDRLAQLLDPDPHRFFRWDEDGRLVVGAARTGLLRHR